MNCSLRFAGACLSAAVLAACAGSNVFSSPRPISVAPRNVSAREHGSRRIGKNVQTESVLYSFASGGDGAFPIAGLTNVGGTLYGTTFQGATSGNGAVHKIKCRTAGCTETLLHSFTGGAEVHTLQPA